MRITIIGAALGAVTAAFLYHQPEIRGLAALNAPRLVHVALFAAWAWAAYFVGRLVTRRVLTQTAPLWEIELALGLVAFGLAAFALAATHLLHAWAARVLTLVVVALSAPTLARLARGARVYFAERWAAATPGTRLLALAALPFAATLLLGAGQPPTHYDVLVYHLYLPKLFNEIHSFVYLPRFAYASMPLGAEMIFTWAYAWDGEGVAGAVAPLINCLMVVATWRLARRYLDNFWATFAALILLFTPTFSQLLNLALVDFVLGAFALMALVVYLRGFGSGRDAAFAGVLLGVALSVKYTGLYALAAFVSLIILDLARRRLAVKNAAVFLGVAFAVVAPWFVKAYVERGNPVFPALYGVFGGRGMSADAAAGLVRSLRGVGMGRNFMDYLLLPYRVSVMGGFGYEKFSGNLWPFSFAAVPLAFIWFRRWRLLLFTIVYFAAWGLIGTQELRFFGTGFGTTAVIIAGVFNAGVVACGRARRVVMAAAVALTLAAGYIINFGAITTNWARLAGWFYEDRNAYLMHWSDRYVVSKFVNEQLPRDAVVLMIFDACLYHLDRRAVADSFNEASETIYAIQKMRTPEEVAAYVGALGADHIMTNRMGGYFWRDYRASARVLWESYLEKYTTVIYRDEYNEVRTVNAR